MSKGTYDADIARYICGTLDLVYHGIVEDTDTKEKTAHISYKGMEQLNFQITLTDDYYPNSIHLCFPMKIKKSSNEVSDIDTNLITVSNVFVHLIKEISITSTGMTNSSYPHSHQTRSVNILILC